MVKGEIFKKILSEEDKINKCLRKLFNLLDGNGRRPLLIMISQLQVVL